MTLLTDGIAGRTHAQGCVSICKAMRPRRMTRAGSCHSGPPGCQ